MCLDVASLENPTIFLAYTKLLWNVAHSPETQHSPLSLMNNIVKVKLPVDMSEEMPQKPSLPKNNNNKKKQIVLIKLKDVLNDSSV